MRDHSKLIPLSYFLRLKPCWGCSILQSIFLSYFNGPNTFSFSFIHCPLFSSSLYISLSLSFNFHLVHFNYIFLLSSLLLGPVATVFHHYIYIYGLGTNCESCMDKTFAIMSVASDANNNYIRDQFCFLRCRLSARYFSPSDVESSI